MHRHGTTTWSAKELSSTSTRFIYVLPAEPVPPSVGTPSRGGRRNSNDLKTNIRSVFCRHAARILDPEVDLLLAKKSCDSNGIVVRV